MTKMLPKGRCSDFIGISTGPMEKGNRGVAGWMSVRYVCPNNEVVNPCFPTAQIEIYQVLGMIMCTWSIFECIMDEMTTLMISYSGKTYGSWRNSQTFQKRLRLHRDLFIDIFGKDTKVSSYHSEALSLIIEPKKVRDGIAHSISTQAFKNNIQSLIFIEGGMRLPTEKRYSQDDLHRMRIEISHAAGFLEQLAIADLPPAKFSTEEICQLNSVFGRERWHSVKSKLFKISEC